MTREYKILIVDYSSLDQATYSRYLQQDTPYKIWLAESGEKGLFLSQQADVILLEVCLPDMTGLEFLQQLQVSHASFPPVIMLTRHGNEAIAAATFKNGASDYLIKDQTNPESLCAAVHQAIERTQLKQQLDDDRTAELVKVNQQLQQELMERQRIEAEFRVLCEAAPIGIFRIDTHGHCTYVNPRAQAICGYTVEEALGDGWHRFIHPDDFRHVLSRWLAATTNHTEFFEEIRYIHHDASKRSGAAHTVRVGRAATAPIVSESGVLIGHVGTIEDITESYAVEEMQREFLSVVSHELKTPLASIRGALALLSSGRLIDDPETAQEMIEIASQDTERLVRLVNDILDLERMESQQLTLTKQWCDAAVLMRRSIESLQPLAEEAQVTLNYQPLMIEIFVDGDRMIQTLINLLGNAIKFSPLQGEIYLGAEKTRDDRFVCFRVQDQGRGIPTDKLNLIFERFQQVDSSDAQKPNGTGLGLAISRNIVQLHGGSIWVESTLGEGSTFFFTVPMAEK
jgi:PAS domain S-box-containing protein